MSKTAEERAYNYASTQKSTKLQVGEIAKHYNNGYNKAMQDFLEKACEWLKENASKYIDIKDGALIFKKTLMMDFKNHMENEM